MHIKENKVLGDTNRTDRDFCLWNVRDKFKRG